MALAALLPLAVTWPAVLHLPDRILGSPTSEVDNHLWMLQVARWRLAGRPGPFSNWPDGWELPMMDPVNLLVAVPASLGGPVAAWNLTVLANLALATAGGWALGRAVAPGAAVVGAVALGTAPFLLGVVDFGLSEAMGLGWLALHLAGLVRWAREGHTESLVGAAAALTGLLWTGWYHALFALLLAPALMVAGWRARGRPLAVLLAWAIPGLTRVPALLDTLAQQGLWAARFPGLRRPEPWPWWRDLPDQGADLLTFVLPRLDAAPTSRTVYLGLGVLLLGLLGGRRAAPWLALAAGLLVFALGPWLRVAGQPVAGGLLLPAGWLTRAVPLLEGFTHWDRATGPATVCLAAAAAVGAARLAARTGRRWLPAALAAVVAVEAVALSPTRFPRTTYAPDPPAALLGLPGERALAQVPVDDAGQPPRDRSRRPYNQWQAFHGRPVAENYEGPDTLLRRAPALATLNGRCGGPLPRGAARELPPDPAPTLAQLDRLGFDWLVVHPDLARDPAACAAAARAWLGPPPVDDPRALGWPTR